MIRRLSAKKAVFLGLDPKPKEKGGGNPKYYLNAEQLERLEGYSEATNYLISKEELELIKGIRDAGKEHGLGLKNLDHGWLKSKTASVHFRNPLFSGPGDSKEIDFDAIIKKYIKPIKVTPAIKKTGVFLFDRLVYTDVHVGMNVNKNGYSLYGGKWDESELLRRLDVMIIHVIENQKSDTLIIDDLGDFMDGWDAETVRKGHQLPQNMDNEKAFDVGLRFKLKLIDSLAEYYKKIIVNNICNDNHAGSFGYIVNSAFKRIIDFRYSHVVVTNYRKFISHYVYGNHCFIITHGKDDKHLKFGFKPILKPDAIEKIDNYIKEHRLYDYEIEFSKGDSHQKIFDESTAQGFNYYNYGAFSPSSEWVQTNFKKGRSFFEFFNYPQCGEKTHNPYVFEWATGREEETIDLRNIS